MSLSTFTQEPQLRKPSDRRCHITVPVMLNVIAFIVIVLSVVTYILTLVYIHRQRFDIIYPEVFYYDVALIVFTVAAAVVHFAYSAMKKKDLIRCIEIFFLIINIVCNIIIAVLQFTAHKSKIDQKVSNFWLNPANREVYLEIEETLRCCGYNHTEERCYATAAPAESCLDYITKTFKQQQIPVAAVQIVLGALMIVFLVIVFTRYCSDRHEKKEEKSFDENIRQAPLNV